VSRPAAVCDYTARADDQDVSIRQNGTKQVCAVCARWVCALVELCRLLWRAPFHGAPSLVLTLSATCVRLRSRLAVLPRSLPEHGRIRSGWRNYFSMA
jgi:hypothetical protein